MTDTRTFIKVHDGIADHPKIDPLSDAAFRLLITSWCWCSKHETDGVMPTRTWEKRGPKKARQELVAAGLVQMGEGQVSFHDYLEHQQSAEQRRASREQRRNAGRAGGLARAKRAASESLSDSPSENQAEVEEEVDKTPSVSARKRATSPPDVFPISDAMAQWAREKHPQVTDLEAATEQFLDYHRGKGSKQVDWIATWRTWIRNATKYERPGLRAVGEYDGVTPGRRGSWDV